MEPDTPPASDTHPSIPVSHPRSSPRSPASKSPSQPPISPPRPSVVTPTATQTTSSSALMAAVPDAAAPPMSCATLSNLAPMVQLDLDPDAQGVLAVTRADSSEPRIPNVYINGLPPNFPEEQLYALTKDFGGVVSVRTFTRHVSDRPSYVPLNPYHSHPLKSSSFSGYGFVLCVWLTAPYAVRSPHTHLLDSTRSRVPKSASRLFDGIEIFTRPFARQVIFPFVISRSSSIHSALELSPHSRHSLCFSSVFWYPDFPVFIVSGNRR
jgi:hypothetical protein